MLKCYRVIRATEDLLMVCWGMLQSTGRVRLRSGDSGSDSESTAVSLSDTIQKWREYREQCINMLHQMPSTLTGRFCNRTFDDYACWPDGVPGTYVNVSCPWYLPWAHNVIQGRVFRYCTSEGTWLVREVKENITIPWRNLTECEDRSLKVQPEQQLSSLSIIYTIGYSLSFSALVIATVILVIFRHLHCTRNYIHLNLFTSFILRAISVFIKDSVLKWMYNIAIHDNQWEGLISYQESLSCRLVFVMMQYCVAANYYWLLVEGIYLHTLLVLSVFSEQRLFRFYLCVGWGVPMLFVLPWGVVKYLYEDDGFVYNDCYSAQNGDCTQPQYGDRSCALYGDNMETLLSHPSSHINSGPALMETASGQDLRIFLLGHSCWTRNYNMNYWLIIRLPILIAIGVNFVIFIRVICIIISKLQANLMCRTDTKCRLAKSTLTLIPLLGTHEIIFAFITDEHAKGSLRYIKLFFELSFSSFQGLMVAVLYCFINNEVQAEFQRRWERWRLEHLYSQRDSSMKPIKFPANSLSSGITMGSSV